jgi:hypothetical protein
MIGYILCQKNTVASVFGTPILMSCSTLMIIVRYALESIINYILNNSHSYVVLDYNRADWSQLKSFLNKVDFYKVSHGDLRTQDVISNFYDIINDCLGSLVPASCCKPYTKSRMFRCPFSVRKKLRKKPQACMANLSRTLCS